MTKKFCRRCKEEKNVEEFYKAFNRKDGLQDWCVQCSKEYDKNNTERKKECSRRYYEENAEYIKEQKKNLRKQHRGFWYEWLKSINYAHCVICNYNDCVEAIDYHHLESNKKKFNVSSFMTARLFNEKNKKELFKELKSCISICVRCHREMHYNKENLWLLERRQ